MAFHGSQRAVSFAYACAFRFSEWQFQAFGSSGQTRFHSRNGRRGAGITKNRSMNRRGREKNDKKMQDSAGRRSRRAGTYTVCFKDRAGRTGA
ncbi:hypothetical protein D3Z50_10270 [Clostridiaceae bacterium]|nr:hypothetical protein [Clostridiaceae bacterium]